MAVPAQDEVRAYYDERVAGKLRDFTQSNPRLEAAIQLIAEWAPANPSRVLEIGCGVGATSWRMARAWPQAEVIATDISPISIQVAKTCFQRSNLTYLSGPLAETVNEGEFDLIVMTDVYEHIPPANRETLHASIRRFLSADSRFILTIPTPATQLDARLNDPSGLQPVDEDISMAEIMTLARDTDTRPLYYREVGIWQYGDYFHTVLGRFEELAEVAIRQQTTAQSAFKQTAKRFLGLSDPQPTGRRDYLGYDVAHRPAAFAERFQVSLAERHAVAEAWVLNREDV